MLDKDMYFISLRNLLTSTDTMFDPRAWEKAICNPSGSGIISEMNADTGWSADKPTSKEKDLVTPGLRLATNSCVLMMPDLATLALVLQDDQLIQLLFVMFLLGHSS